MLMDAPSFSLTFFAHSLIYFLHSHSYFEFEEKNQAAESRENFYEKILSLTRSPARQR